MRQWVCNSLLAQAASGISGSVRAAIRWTGSLQDERTARSVGFVGLEIDDGGHGRPGRTTSGGQPMTMDTTRMASSSSTRAWSVGDLLVERGHDGAVDDRGGVDGSDTGDGHQL